MSELTSLGKWFVLTGATLIVLGSFILIPGKIPFLGRLPGDIRVEKGNFSFYFPVMTCILASGLLSIILRLVSKLK